MSDFFQQPSEMGNQSSGTETNAGASAPNSPQQTQSQQSQQVPSNTQNMSQQEITALEKLERFKFGDREWTPESLKKAIMRQEDYTKKTQAISQIKTYHDNLRPDLEAVKSNPRLADEFRKLYPKEFHAYLDYVLGKSEERAEQSGGNSNGQGRMEIPKELQSRLDRVESYVKEKEVEKYEANLDTTFAKLSTKYPDGDEEKVLARAQVMLDNDPDAKIDEATWDRLWKQSHDQMTERYKKKQETLFNSQRSANSKSKDMGAGGGTPGQAPVRVKFKDVADQMINNLKGK